ncbi:anthocyanidin 3-O-glucosyltransferase 2-like [Senna tora]|uniref:Glycosyltransferase n=1 Tax=Senna tora TaxID=362788 RepID=A0A834WSQ1_9FABA|nr:anthocyanidin 3-O-glucosyltransferase 2-like [Senna tora]
MTKSLLVFVPSPGMGHLVSAVEFAKLLLNHDHRLSIAVFIIKSPSQSKTQAYVDSLASNPNFPKSLQFIHLPHPDSQSPAPYLHDLVQKSLPLLKDSVSDLVHASNSSPDSPRLAAFIVDMFCTAVIDVADELDVPSMIFFTSGAAFLGFMLHFLELRDRYGLDTTASGFKDSGAELPIPSFVNPVPAYAFPAVVLEKQWEQFLFNYIQGLKKAKGFIVNTFEELESHAVQSFSDSNTRVYPVGPILNLNSDDKLVQEKSDIMEWLDDQPSSSVIYLCFGSRGFFEEDQVREIARALESSGFRFLWSLRKPPPKDSRESAGEYSISELSGVLPEGFLERTAGIGRIIGWAPQTMILAHQAVGGFVSHCGWNSTLESIYFGVPVATWPLYAEQQTNAFELVCDLKMAVEISLDYRIAFGDGSKTEVLSAERIEEGIRKLMEEENETRTKVKQMSENMKPIIKAQEKSDIIGWLDNQPPSSVIFLCFGSKGFFEKDERDSWNGWLRLEKLSGGPRKRIS